MSYQLSKILIWLELSNSPAWSFWPWTSIKKLLIFFIKFKEIASSFKKHWLLPLDKICLLKIISSLVINPLSFANSIALWLQESLNNAVTLAASWPFLIKRFSDLFPSIKFIASTIIDFPAPVSPVSTVKPSLKSNSNFSIKTIFFIER